MNRADLIELERIYRNVGDEAAARWCREELALLGDEPPAFDPQVGDGVTVHLWSDSRAYTVVRRTAKRIWLRRDRATLLNGVNSGEPDALQFYPGGFVGHTSGAQRWAYTPDENGETEVASLRSDGKWRVANSTRPVTAGRFEHYDYNF